MSFLDAIRPILLVAILAGVAAMSPKPPAKTIDPAPAAFQAWRNALVEIDLKSIGPRQRGIFGRLRHVEGFFADLPVNAKLPAVLYLHDCPGLKIEAVRDVEELAAIGFAVFAPDSFDSRARKSDCIRFDFVAGLNPEAYVQRQAEIAVALAELRKLPWVDQSAIILYGLGEGALAAANYPGHEFRGVVLTGWTCGASQYAEDVAGLKTPADLPILALVSRYDPWFDRTGHAGTCGDYMTGHKYGQSIVIENRGLHHITWMDDRASAAVRRFLKTLMPPRL
ncbi:MAG TPA: dienelactone hydrolase family protein [Dongiaceae bacterium]|nr:dienelactone hydrolase family protein [Dongiaceae bacterium]